MRNMFEKLVDNNNNLQYFNIPTATGVSFPSASMLVASNWWCNNPFFGVNINRKSL